MRSALLDNTCRARALFHAPLLLRLPRCHVKQNAQAGSGFNRFDRKCQRNRTAANRGSPTLECYEGICKFVSVVNPLLPGALYNERHYSVAEISEKWGLSRDLVRELFRDEEDVVAIERPAISKRKRRYTTLSVPESVVRRVHAKLSKRRLMPSRGEYPADSVRKHAERPN